MGLIVKPVSTPLTARSASPEIDGTGLPWDGAADEARLDPRGILLNVATVHRLWWPTYGITTAAGPTITSWLDSVANTDLATGTAPGVASVGNYPVVPDFDGTDDVLVLTPGSDYVYAHDGSGMTAFVVCRWDGTTGLRQIFGTNNTATTGHGFAFERITTGEVKFSITNGSAEIVTLQSAATPLADSDDTVHVLLATYDVAAATDAELWVDGTSVASGDDTGVPSSTNSSAFSLGARSSGARPFNGPILAAGLFQSALAGSDLSTVHDALLGAFL